MSDANGSGKSGQPRAVQDEENQAQNATIRRIQSFRDDIAEYQLLFARNELTEDMSESQQYRAYHQVARGFCQLLKPYLTAQDIDQSERYWRQLPLGEFEVDPPDAIRRPERQRVGAALGNDASGLARRADPRNDVEPRRYELQGLQDFWAAEVEWREDWQVMYGPEVNPADIRAEVSDPDVRVHERSTRTEPIRVSRIARLPRPIIDEAITAMENFVRDLGMDIDLEDQGTDIIRHFDMSGDEPSAEYGRAEYDGDPEI